MSKSLGIVLAASGVAFGNDWIQTDKPNFRILVAGLGAGALFAGIEKVNPQAAIGLSTIALITALLTPIHGHSVWDTVGNSLGLNKKVTQPPHIGKPPSIEPHPLDRRVN